MSSKRLRDCVNVERKSMNTARYRRAGHPRVKEPGGNAARSHERYLALARDAASRGDEVEMENCYQHAEHFFRT